MSIEHKNNCKFVSFLVLVFYFLIRFFALDWLEQFSVYAGYFLDLVLVGASVFVLGYESFISGFRRVPLAYYAVLSLGICGFFISYSAPSFGLIIPFNLHDRTTLALLLFIGPVLEEWVFRYSVLNLTEKIISKSVLQRNAVIIAINASLFSAAHGVAYFQVPVEFQGFVLYQIGYTFFLGAVCAYYAFKNQGSLRNPVLIHMAFNFGFYVGGL